jgi:hypothetical protein
MLALKTASGLLGDGIMPSAPSLVNPTRCANGSRGLTRGSGLVTLAELMPDASVDATNQ